MFLACPNFEVMYLYSIVYCDGSNREVCECVAKVRLISWLVMGALCNCRANTPLRQCVPQDATCHITDHIQVWSRGNMDSKYEHNISYLKLFKCMLAYVIS